MVGERGSWVYDKATGKLRKLPERPKPGPRIYVQQDTRDAFESPITGEMFDSMSAYRRHLREHGYFEKGGERAKRPEGFDLKVDEDEVYEDVQLAAQQIKWGMAPSTSDEREIWEKEERERKRRST